MDTANSQKGKFILFDGPSASGKNTIIKELLLKLDTVKTPYFYFEEVTSEGYGKEAILQARKEGEKRGRYGDKGVVEAFVKERQKLYSRYVLPQLAVQTYVIANRGEPSTLAYQTIHNEVTMQQVWDLHKNNNIILPDLVVLTNCTVQEALSRESRRGPVIDSKTELQGKFTAISKSLPENALKKREKIHAQYKKVKTFLEAQGVQVLYLETDILSVSDEVSKILDMLKQITAS